MTPTAPPRVTQHTLNTKGRDLIVADVHGCYDSLMRVLELAKFDPACDRLFSVGDLIDRGPKSWEVLQLIKEPWMFAVRGNHEDMLLSALEKFESVYHSGDDFLPNGGRWILELTDAQMTELQTTLAEQISALPHVRTLLDDRGQVACHVAHAELLRPAAGVYLDLTNDIGEKIKEGSVYTDRELDCLARGEQPGDWNEDYFMAVCTWSRRVVRQVMSDSRHDRPVRHLSDFPVAQGPSVLAASPAPYAPGLSPVFVGHSILERLAMHASHIFTDLGCFNSYQATNNDRGTLTLIDVRSALSWLNAHLPRPAEAIMDPLRPSEFTVLPLPPLPEIDFSRPRDR